jgi:hypothetical protein
VPHGLGASRAGERAFPVLLAGLALLLWAPRLCGPLDLRYDAGMYYVLGTSLAQGKGYRLLNEPGEVEAVLYPPLLPLLVAAHQWLAGTSDYLVVGQWLRVTFLVLATLYALAAYGLARRFLAPPYAFAAALVCVLHVQAVYLTDALFAELPFALAATLSLLLSARGKGRWNGALAGACAVAAYLLRTAGVAVLAAWAVQGWLQGGPWLAARRAALALVPVLAWHAYVRGVTEGDAYRHPAYPYQRAPYQFYNVPYAQSLVLRDLSAPELGRASAGGLARRFLGNLLRMPRAVGEALSAPEAYWGWAASVVSGGLRGVPVLPALLALGGLSLAGLAVLAARRQWLVPTYAAVSLALTCLTPWPEQFWRYLMPLAPVLALALFVPLVACQDWLRRRIGRPWGTACSVPAVAAAVLAVQLFTLAVHYRRFHNDVPYRDAAGNERAYRLINYDADWRAFDAALDRLRERAGGRGVIATSVPHAAHLRTGLKAVLPPMEASPEEAQRLLDSVPVTYLVVEGAALPGFGRRYAAPVVERHPERWRLIDAVPGTGLRIYERVP